VIKIRKNVANLMGEKDGVSNFFQPVSLPVSSWIWCDGVCVSLSVHFLKLCVAYFKKRIDN